MPRKFKARSEYFRLDLHFPALALQKVLYLVKISVEKTKSINHRERDPFVVSKRIIRKDSSVGVATYDFQSMQGSYGRKIKGFERINIHKTFD